MVLLIHLAPVGANAPPQFITTPESRGFVRIVVNPWGKISIDGQPRAVTPIAAPIPVPAGTHTIEIDNDYFEPFSRDVDVPAGSVEEPIELFVDLEKESQPVLRIEPDEDKQQ
jgi:PEGA domain